jgi:hypothetical protein
MIRRCSLLLILAVMLGLLIGCSERIEPTTFAGSSTKADTALKEAQRNLNLAGVKTTFDDPGALSKPADFIPVPSELARVDRQENLNRAIEQLNIVVSELDQEVQSGSSFEPAGSLSDRGIVHFYLGLSYILEAISRLLLSDDPETTFILEYDPNAPTGVWFTYDISQETKTKLDSTTNPLDYPLAFTIKERQAIIDAIDLISDATAKPSSARIQPQASSVNGPPYIHSAIWHFIQAINLLGEYNPELRQSLQDFNDQIDKFESLLQTKAKSWGFSYTKASWR